MMRTLVIAVVCGGCVVLEAPSLVRCQTNAECGSGEQCLELHCRPASCADGRLDGLETDLDCGGAHCAPCGGGALCLNAGDCAARSCLDHRCVEPTCTDGIANGLESDVDCGGACPKCALGGACELTSDCQLGACVDGRCAVGQGSCAGASCGGICVDPNVDPMNCGRCGNVCPAPMACVAGQCAQLCIGGSLECGGACVDPSSNPQHCGGCNRPCGAGTICVNAACVPTCAPNQVRCGGGPCVSLDRDPSNCGQCGRSCPGTSACVANQCVPLCAAPLLTCGSACVDPRTDPMNCGGCNAPCMTGGSAAKACFGGMCRIVSCAPGFDDCNGQEPDGCEVDLNLSAANCGQCGRTCPAAEMCLGGACCAPAPPQGSYLTSCRNCEACNGLLRCECPDAAANYQMTSFPLTVPCADITNCNGALQCQGC